MSLIIPSTAGIVAAITIMSRETGKIEEEQVEERKKTTQNLLLKGDYNSMEINPNEKIIIVRMVEGDRGNWSSTLDSKKICKNKNFTECFNNTINAIKPKAISVIPYSADKFNITEYLLMLKIPDEEAITAEKIKQEVLNKIAEDMSTDIATAVWQ